MSSGWFNTLGWWEQEEAYAAFDTYRANPTNELLDEAIVLALPIIRVVYSTQKFKVTYMGDEDDLISHAAYTITKAIPKMADKEIEKLNTHQKDMRYLFTCVVNAFYREYDVLHGKHNKLEDRIKATHTEPDTSTVQNIYEVEAELTLKRIPKQLFSIAISYIRFEGKLRRVCVYILAQMIQGREIAKSVLQLMGCDNRNFMVQYCTFILTRAFLLLRERKPEPSDHHMDIIGISAEENAMFDGDLGYA
jgi:hypothetical protein